MTEDDDTDYDGINPHNEQTTFDGKTIDRNTMHRNDTQPDNCEFSGFCDMESMLGGFPSCFRPFDNKNRMCRRYAPHCQNDPAYCGGDDGSVQCRTCRGCVLSKEEMAYTHYRRTTVREDDATDEDMQPEKCVFSGSCGIELMRDPFPKCYRSLGYVKFLGESETCIHYAPQRMCYTVWDMVINDGKTHG